MRARVRRLSALAPALLSSPAFAAYATEADEDVSLPDGIGSPYVCIVSPSENQSYGGSDSLTVEVRGDNVTRIAVELRLAD